VKLRPIPLGVKVLPSLPKTLHMESFPEKKGLVPINPADSAFLTKNKLGGV